MSKTNRPNYRRADREDRSRRSSRRDRRIVVRGVRRDPPDLRKLSRAVIALAMAEMEAENTPVTEDALPGEQNVTEQPDTVQADATEPELSPDTSADDGVRP
ncbi:Uncharacterised protein [Mycobacteroides abscessus subsp. abscessus]|uniref:hypothetical protein n=1 Tax=Mycobacteroides abscessus TaxID=36809 RepID=UPI0009284C27|nr:hypothetical protein [Mycobacteroides abscessus]SHQ95840.1 Uncharacterised protein [Mycobacteroides abscessus subsp. abscessus]